MRKPMRIPFADPGEKQHMSIMINEAQSSYIAKILSIENLEKIAHLLKRNQFSQITFFSKMLIAYTGQE